jgi:hypothetical protein
MSPVTDQILLETLLRLLSQGIGQTREDDEKTEVAIRSLGQNGREIGRLAALHVADHQPPGAETAATRIVKVSNHFR